MDKKERIRKYGEVFTPQWVFERMCNDLEKENPDAFLPGSTFLEPSCGEGIFIAEVLRRKFSRCKKRSDYTTSIASVYGFELQAENVKTTIGNIVAICQEYFRPSKSDLQLISDHIIQADALKVMKMMSDPALQETGRNQKLTEEMEIKMSKYGGTGQ